MVTIAAPTGTGTKRTATATAVLTNGVVTAVVINDPGLGYVVRNPSADDRRPRSPACKRLRATMTANVSPTGVAGPQSGAADNLVLNATNGLLNVTFDRDMDPSTFTPAQVLAIVGPAGSVLKAADLQHGHVDPGPGRHPRQHGHGPPVHDRYPSRQWLVPDQQADREREHQSPGSTPTSPAT